MNNIGLFEKIFPKSSVNIATDGYFKTLTAYQPRFTSFSGGVYEALLCRSAIHTFANHAAKLKPESLSNDKGLKYVLAHKPNPWQNTFQFLYRTATILETDTTAFIVPLQNISGTKTIGFYTVKPSDVEIKEYKGIEYIQFHFPTGSKAIVELSKVGVLTKYQYEDDLFGSGNKPLFPTIRMIDTQDQGVVEGVKNSATIRFLAVLDNVLKKGDIEKERKIFAENNLSDSNTTGVMMFDQKYKEVKQIESKAILIDDKQMQQIKNNVYTYFNINEGILMNKWSEDEWNSYYEGKVEPFAIQISQVLTNMIYNNNELSYGNEIIFSANRLQYASNKTKLEIVTQLFDRGMMSTNQGLEIFNMAPIEDGDKLYIRKEYAEIDKLAEAQGILPQNPMKNKKEEEE